MHHVWEVEKIIAYLHLSNATIDVACKWSLICQTRHMYMLWLLSSAMFIFRSAYPKCASEFMCDVTSFWNMEMSADPLFEMTSPVIELNGGNTLQKSASHVNIFILQWCLHSSHSNHIDWIHHQARFRAEGHVDISSSTTTGTFTLVLGFLHEPAEFIRLTN